MCCRTEKGRVRATVLPPERYMYMLNELAAPGEKGEKRVGTGYGLASIKKRRKADNARRKAAMPACAVKVPKPSVS